MHSLRSDLRALAQTHMRVDTAHDLAHLDRVWANAQDIAQGQDANPRVLLAGCYLHDLINLPKNDPNRHLASSLSAEGAAPLLAALDFSTIEIKSAQHAILTHSFSAGIPPETLEAQILQDADRLDSLGAIGIARTFVVAGALDLALYDPSDAFATNRPLDDSQWALDHWQVKLLKLPTTMLTPKGRDIAEQRCRVMRAFLAQLAIEIHTPLPGHLSL